MNTNKQEFQSINSEKYNTEVNQVIESIQKDFLDATSDDVKLNLLDLQNILNKKNTLHAVKGKYTGKDESLKSFEIFMQNSTLNVQSLDKISDVLISFRIHPNYPIAQLSKVIELISEKINNDSDLIWGTVTDDLLDKDLTIINGLFLETQEN